MDRLTVTLKTVTPLFLGGANPNEKAELRAPSIKGALRFWYRAIDLEYNKICDYPDSKPHTWEEKIFGSAEHGQGCFGIKVYSSEPDIVNPGDNRWKKSSIAYLGYGPIEKGITKKPYIPSGFEFTVEFLFKSAEQIDDMRLKVERSLWALLMFGGLGSRSRRGFGSVMVKKIVGKKSDLIWQFENCKKLKESMNLFFNDTKGPDELPEYTCWSKKADYVVISKDMNCEAALKWLGNELHAYRSYYGGKNFSDDRLFVLNYLEPAKFPLPSSFKLPLPLRTSFGLPHNYFFTNSLYKVAADINFMNNAQKGRRASPLFLHIQELTNRKACVVVTYLPARLIPRDEMVTISSDNRPKKKLKLPDDFSAVIGFMKRLSAHVKETTS